LASVAGSDAHSLEELGARPVTIEGTVQSRADLVAALLAGRCLPAPRPDACRAPDACDRVREFL
ncbi:MAG TPA: PHP-associated domain-containing protein, partial [Solidesulfovibrio sp.]|nr:hypothetical protein [Desulfovibrio sp.]HML61174.1 PHP-associated domain-containing protein [Solidesulfovibrio sp.]